MSKRKSMKNELILEEEGKRRDYDLSERNGEIAKVDIEREGRR